MGRLAHGTSRQLRYARSPARHSWRLAARILRCGARLTPEPELDPFPDSVRQLSAVGVTSSSGSFQNHVPFRSNSATCQAAYALNLISPFAKSTVPGAQPWIGFTQEYSAAEVKSVTFSRSCCDQRCGVGHNTPSAKTAIFSPSSVVIAAWTWSSIRPSARTLM